MANLLIPFDTYERNRKISGFLEPGAKVLDVGGGATGIKTFTRASVTTVDLFEGDIKADARSLVMPSSSYETVTCIDVLEHIALTDRKKVIDNLIRIAKDKIIISAPYGSSEHELAEKALLKDISRKGIDVAFLLEHVQNGLPTPVELLSSVKHEAKVFYSGDFRISNLLFRLHVYEMKDPVLNRLLYAFKRLLNIFLNTCLYTFWFSDHANRFTNRFYVIIEK